MFNLAILYLMKLVHAKCDFSLHQVSEKVMQQSKNGLDLKGDT